MLMHMIEQAASAIWATDQHPSADLVFFDNEKLEETHKAALLRSIEQRLSIDVPDEAAAYVGSLAEMVVLVQQLAYRHGD